MSQGVNKVFLVGYVGKAPEVKQLDDGRQVANFPLATTDHYKDKQGQKQEKTEWHNIVAWGKLAGVIGEYVDKGKQLHIEGKLSTRSWETKDGEKRYRTEIVLTQMVFLGGKDAVAGAGDESAPF